VAFAAHELQEPLRVVTGFLSFLERRAAASLDPTAREYLREARDGATRAQTMVRDLMTYARAGATTLLTGHVALVDVVELATADLAGSIADAAAIVTHDELPVVVGDAERLRQVFVNLLGNAIKFHGDDAPLVHVAAVRRGDRWEVVVTDNGVGVPSESRDDLFQLFQRAHGARFPGSGVGLAICKRIVEAHGGSIWMTPGATAGTAVHFTLAGGDDL